MWATNCHCFCFAKSIRVFISFWFCILSFWYNLCGQLKWMMPADFRMCYGMVNMHLCYTNKTYNEKNAKHNCNLVSAAPVYFSVMQLTHCQMDMCVPLKTNWVSVHGAYQNSNATVPRYHRWNTNAKVIVIVFFVFEIKSDDSSDDRIMC